MNIDLSKYDLVNPTQIELIKKQETFYDITVKDNHTFFIKGEQDNILTHNCDGDHISGLLIGLFFKFWPQLFDEGRIYKVLTPIVVVKNKKETLEFYSDLEYLEWERKTKDLSKWNIEYKKGLGALEDLEYKKMINSPKKVQLKIDKDSSKLIEIWLGKNSDKRKEVIPEMFDVDIIYDKDERNISEFFNNEYLSFALYTIQQRAIPSIIDGLKPTQRKVINDAHITWKTSDKPLKIFQFGGSIANRQKFHHSDKSLNDGIVNLAQSFKNNLPLLQEIGQFGDLRSVEAGAPRYISTKLSPVFDSTYKDFDLLDYKYEEGDKVEPKYFLPIIPMLLVNGTDGIAVGYKTKVLNRNTKDVINLCLNILNGKKLISPKPHYNQFGNNVETYQDSENPLKWYFKGKIEIVSSSSVKITELPPQYQFTDYEAVLNKLIEKKFISDYTDNCKNGNIEYVVKMQRKDLDGMKVEELMDKFKLIKSETEMIYVLNEENRLRYIENPLDVATYFVEFRLKYYVKRRELLKLNLDNELSYYSNRMKFIELVMKNKIKIQKVPLKEIETQIEQNGLVKHNNSYSYLTSLPVTTFSNESIETLKNKIDKIKSELEALSKTTAKDLYILDLNNLMKEIK